MRTERYWQAEGNHKSNSGSQSVFGELSVAKLLFINQEDLLPNKRSVGQALILLVSSPELRRTSIITHKAAESFFEVAYEKTHRRKKKSDCASRGPTFRQIAKLIMGFSALHMLRVKCA